MDWFKKIFLTLLLFTLYGIASYALPCFLVEQSISNDNVSLIKRLESENNYLKQRLASITDSLRSNAVYEEALAKHNENQQQNKEKQYFLQKQSLLEKDEELSRVRENKNALIITGFAFIAVSIFTIIYLRQKHKISINAESHRVELTLQREKELKHRYMIENISGRIEAQEHERERIARELHDGIGGNLVAIRLQLQSLDSENPAIDEVERLVAKTHEEIRAISHNLATPRLDETPFEQLFYHHIRHLKSNENLHVDGNLLPQSGWSNLNVKLQTELFRLIQELSGNIVKHSKATKVSLTLRRDSHTINILAEDNGVGFVHVKGNEGIGIQNIKNRIKYLNGNLDLTSIPGEGTVFIAEIPIN